MVPVSQLFRTLVWTFYSYQSFIYKIYIFVVLISLLYASCFLLSLELIWCRVLSNARGLPRLLGPPGPRCLRPHSRPGYWGSDRCILSLTWPKWMPGYILLNRADAHQFREASAQFAAQLPDVAFPCRHMEEQDKKKDVFQSNHRRRNLNPGVHKHFTAIGRTAVMLH